VRGDAAVVGENRNRLYVLVTRRAQRQPLGLEDGNTALSPGLREDFFRQGHFTGCSKETERGTRHPVSPFSKPILGPPVRLGTGGGGLVRSTGLLGRSLPHRKYRYERVARGFGLELNATVDQREQRVVPAQTDIAARMPFGAALARDNVAGDDFLAAKNLDSEALTARITAVARGSACFLMSHRSKPFSLLIPDS